MNQGHRNRFPRRAPRAASAELSHRGVLRRMLAVVFGGLGIVAVGASVAWACAAVTSPYLNALQPNHGPAGAMVTVSGGNWDSNTDVNLTWVPTGQPLGTARPAGGNFSIRVTIPAGAEVGQDYVAYVRGSQGSAAANTPYGIDSPAHAASPGGPAGSTSASTSGGNGAPPAANPVIGTYNGGSGGIPSAPPAADAPAAAPVAAAPAPAPAAPPVAAVAPAADVSAPLAAAPAPVAPPTPPSPGPANSGPGFGGPGVGGGSGTGGPSAGPVPLVNPASSASANLAPAAVAAPAANGLASEPRPAEAKEEAAPASGPGIQAAYGDLWGGFAQGPATAVPSMVDLPATARATSPVAVGAGLLTGGLLALVAGFGLAEVRSRRRVLAEG